MSQQEREIVILDALRHLNDTDQEKLVAYASSLWGHSAPSSNYNSLKGLFGTMSDEDAQEMMRIIEEGCEQINDEPPPQF